MLVSIHGGLSRGGFGITEDFSRQASPAFFTPARLLCALRTRWVADVCCGFVPIVLSNFFTVIIPSWIAYVFIEGRFASARMASTGVVQSSQVMARPS